MTDCKIRAEENCHERPHQSCEIDRECEEPDRGRVADESSRATVRRPGWYCRCRRGVTTRGWPGCRMRRTRTRKRGREGLQIWIARPPKFRFGPSGARTDWNATTNNHNAAHLPPRIFLVHIVCNFFGCALGCINGRNTGRVPRPIFSEAARGLRGLQAARPGLHRGTIFSYDNIQVVRLAYSQGRWRWEHAAQEVGWLSPSPSLLTNQATSLRHDSNSLVTNAGRLTEGVWGQQVADGVFMQENLCGGI